MRKSYTTRLVRDLAVTFNGAPLTTQDIAYYWKRSRKDVDVAAAQLADRNIIKVEPRTGALTLSKSFLRLWNANSTEALATI